MDNIINTLKNERLITRENGTEIRLIVEYSPNLFGRDDYTYYALVKEKGDDAYRLFQEDALLSVVTPTEVLSLGAELLRRKP
jgi:hypothetical protein